MLKALTQAQAPLRASHDAMEKAQLAPDLETRKCDSGDLNACVTLINVFHAGSHPDPLRAAEFRRKAAALLGTQCSSGKADACDAMADILIDLGGSDRARGLAIYDQSCNAGRLEACIDLAAKTEDREQKEAAFRRALPIKEAHCNARTSRSCLWLALHTQDPQKRANLGTNQSDRRSKKFWNAARSTCLRETVQL
jgi:TPR repeat protein